MKYLIQYSFSTKNPLYLIPNLLNYIFGRNQFFDTFRFGVGTEDAELFGEDKFHGTELTGIITGVFGKNWTFNKSRIEQFKQQPFPVEVFHACTARSAFKKRSQADWNLNLCKDDDNTRMGIAASIYLAKDLIETNPIVNFHFGKFPAGNRRQARRSLLKNLNFAKHIAQQESVLITLENSYSEHEKESTFGADPEDIKGIIDEVDSEHVKVCLDWGHANVHAKHLHDQGKLTNEELQSFEFHKRFINVLEERIGYAHIHYNFAHKGSFAKERNIMNAFRVDKEDQHLPINRIKGEEKKNYLKTLQLLKNKTSISKYGKIMLELTRDFYFGFIPFNKWGANTKDALESLEIVKDVFRQ